VLSAGALPGARARAGAAPRATPHALRRQAPRPRAAASHLLAETPGSRGAPLRRPHSSHRAGREGGGGGGGGRGQRRTQQIGEADARNIRALRARGGPRSGGRRGDRPPLSPLKRRPGRCRPHSRPPRAARARQLRQPRGSPRPAPRHARAPRPAALHGSARPAMAPRTPRRGVLLVTAHPDDEAMFFGPALAHFAAAGADAALLCLSNGAVAAARGAACAATQRCSMRLHRPPCIAAQTRRPGPLRAAPPPPPACR
jgi:hypothetical protein